MRLISDVMQSILPAGMRASTRPALDSSRLLALGALAVSLGGCKAASGTQAASPAASLDDIVEIESELAVNAERLEAQGVRIARAKDSRRDGADAAGIDLEAKADDDAESSPSPTPPAEPRPGDSVTEPPEAVAPQPVAPPPPARAAEEDAAGLPLAGRTRNKAKKQRRAQPTRCERICDLAETTCALADRICELADEHVDDVRYEDACERAGSQCEAASEACAVCDE